ncbi:MAG: hypothetical protein H6Q00_1395 [Holophagaceae bacterium]|nr:hypothetical protein [Holophagaceae bacterium]
MCYQDPTRRYRIPPTPTLTKRGPLESPGRDDIQAPTAAHIVADDHARLEAQCDRYHEALEEIADLGDADMMDGDGARLIAYAALGRETK